MVPTCGMSMSSKGNYNITDRLIYTLLAKLKDYFKPTFSKSHKTRNMYHM